MPKFRFKLHNNGAFHHTSGVPFMGHQLSDQDVEVTHLKPHVQNYNLGGGTVVKVLINYSSHCWTCKANEAQEEWRGLTIWDHQRARCYDPIRHQTSFQLPQLMGQLMLNRIYVTPTDRNYGCYNATLRDLNGHFYTAYFTLKTGAGKFDGVRHKFRLFVESAYPKEQQEEGSKTSLPAIIGKARQNKTVKYRRP